MDGGKPSVAFDEKAKRRSDQYGCLDMVTGSDLGESRVAQNLEMGQKVYPDRNILGPG